MDRELIVLAGGLGTRLRERVPDLPKCMAPVHGKPFIDYVMAHFLSQGVERFIFALGYQSDVAYEYLLEKYSQYQLKFSIEREPLGTGGAIGRAAEMVAAENVLVTNGDTLFKCNIQALAAVHHQAHAECTLALKPMRDFERFGAVEANANGRIVSFQEKRHHIDGCVNAGVYLLNVKKFLNRDLGTRFSFEKDYLERFVQAGPFFASVQDAYFIDMGVPADYDRAEKELK